MDAVAKRVRMQDVASAAGVSRTTASFVLSGRAASIPETTRKRVLQAASSMGYQHNRMAARLREGRSRLIGLVIAGIENPFFASFIATTERLVHETGYELVLDATASEGGFDQTRSKIAGWPIDGVLMWGHSRNHLEQIVGLHLAKTLPTVQLAATYDEPDVDAVFTDHAQATRDLWKHLRERGYERIAFLAPEHVALGEPHAELRLSAYKELCRGEGREPEVIVAPSRRDEMGRRFGRELGLEMARRKPADRPRAIMCFNDLFAIGMIHGLRRGALRVPEDIAIAGFDGIAEGQDLDRPLTTAYCDMELLCQTSLEVLMARLGGEGDERAPTRKVVVPVPLWIGETT